MMQILHGTWIPQPATAFVQTGGFCLWVETEQKSRRKLLAQAHPFHLAEADLLPLLTDELGLKSPDRRPLESFITPRTFLLPTVDGQPLPSLELSRYLEVDIPDSFDWQYWQMDCYQIPVLADLIALLNNLHFLAVYNLAEVQLGADLLFWYHYTQAFKQVILRDQYIPALKYLEVAATKVSTRRKAAGAKTTKKQTAISEAGFEIYPGWEIIGDRYNDDLQTYIDYMPLLCVAGFEEPLATPTFYDRETLLRHFSECWLNELVRGTAFPQNFLKPVEGTLIQDCLQADLQRPEKSVAALERYQQWQGWRDRIVRTQTDQTFYLYFHLQDPFKPEDPWQLQFQVAPKHDPSLRVSLDDYWRMRPKQQAQVKAQLGDDFEQHLLMNLGYAARIYPDLWSGLETDEPVGIYMNLATAFTFLKESAWVLEDAGYKVIVPAWWTPKGRQRAKVRLRAKGKSLSGSDKSKGYFSYDTLVQYQYDLAIGDQPVTEQEWQQLVNAKSPLVKFRGQWMELDQDKMQQMLEFWQQQQAENPEMSLLDFMRLTSGEADDSLEVEFDRDDALANMLTQLSDKTRLKLTPDPDQLRGHLRDYQKRGLSWLHYLENLGLNGCLADDMGLGKTIQVIARLIQEREEAAQTGNQPLPPTLLIAPTSVVGNWYHEIQKFAPHLRAVVHHGGDRSLDAKAFKALCRDHDLVITSFTLARKDVKLLEGVTWHRIVLDEAQNIKNPKTAQTKAILKLNANHRLALTGTPVENRLMDLWSIFNFLNPGYLGTQTQFRKQFELPIQKENSPARSATLKKLVEPFILRRLKTDQSIIKDLPDKVEQKLFCNLTPEQASLYEAVLKDVTEQLETSEGIQRQGLILATLTKLKQICNHPRQFLQDDSDFTPERSHKLSRLLEMLDEVVAEGESALVFSQFREIGDALEHHLRHTCHYNTYYIHGGTNRKKREQMIAAFQDPDTEPAIFVLSLKAAGVGITLTQANHVFHFDRWWNPAVEDQATDRAFRIGQKKNVFVHKFVAMGTLEERIDQMIEDKKKLAGAIVGADESWLTELDNDAFKQLIALNKSAIMD
jgi:SNF2 family DNA or RNA helicase